MWQSVAAPVGNKQMFQVNLIGALLVLPESLAASSRLASHLGDLASHDLGVHFLKLRMLSLAHMERVEMDRGNSSDICGEIWSILKQMPRRDGISYTHDATLTPRLLARSECPRATSPALRSEDFPPHCTTYEDAVRT